MKITPQCPECRQKDCCEFVFVRHILENGTTDFNNPSDYRAVYICANLHVFYVNERCILVQQDEP